MTVWRLSDRADPAALPLADRHYNRQHIGSPQYVPPSTCVCLVSVCRRAVWVTTWPKAEYVKHEWPGAWINSLFRNEGAGLSSTLIREAIALTRAVWLPPERGLITFVDETKVHHKRDAGRCYRKAGFTLLRDLETRKPHRTKAGLLVYQLLPNEMPEPDYSLTAPLFE